MSETANKIENFETLDSTSIKAKELASRGEKPWTVVRAVKQKEGYGRKGSGWFSPEGGLYFSVILPKSNIDDLQTLTILAAYVVAKAVKENFNAEPLIKLPNDVYLNGKKICGTLTENVIGSDIKSSVMGIGLNTNIEKFGPELENSATSLKIELKREIDNEALLRQIIEGLKKTLATISE
jgi:BirA family biotin operon repressor/biotin-[acetyl-CoA-carboxylase] ligase